MKIFEFVQHQKQEYESHPVELPSGKTHSQPDMLKRIDLNWSNEYYEEASDNVIGKYPYDGIAKPIVLLEARATDFDFKHIEVEPKRPDRVSRVSTMIATKGLHEYSRKHNIAGLLNDICFTRPKYGGVFVKRTKEGVVVVPWQNLITDQVDPSGSPIIERLYFTPSELKKQKQWKNLDEAIDEAEAQREANLKPGAPRNRSQGNLIEVYSIEGELPLAYLLDARDEEYDEDDMYEYVRCLIICTAYGDQEKGDLKGTILYANEKKESSYMYLARNPMVGRGQGESVFESLREHQKWHNFTKTEEMRMIAVAGKKVYVTNDPDILTNVFDKGIDHGTVLRVGRGANGEPNFLQELNQLPTGTPIYQAIREEWAESATKTTSAFPAKLGEEAKAGTPFRAQYLQNVEASSQFEQYREEIGTQLITPMVEEWILPDAMKELLEEDSIYTTFTPKELQLIDSVLIEKEVEKAYVELTLAGQVITPEMLELLRQEITLSLRREGSKRSIKNIKKFVKEVDGNVIIHTTDESRNKAVLFESYANLLTALLPEDPRRNAIIDRIMDSMGVTKDELDMYAEQALVQTAQNPKMEQEEAKKQANPATPALSLT